MPTLQNTPPAAASVFLVLDLLLSVFEDVDGSTLLFGFLRSNVTAEAVSDLRDDGCPEVNIGRGGLCMHEHVCTYTG